MASKNKLKRRLNKQRIRYKLSISDLQIENNKLRYNLNFSEDRVSKLETENDKLNSKIFSLTQELATEKLVADLKISERDNITHMQENINGSEASIVPSERPV